MTERALTRLWRSWARDPRNVDTNKLEDEVQREAAELGMTGTELRIAVTDRLIAGEKLSDAIEEVVGPASSGLNPEGNQNGGEDWERI